ncbi:hypothetical protein LXL04_033680 [Taraxacum kok-saghyz]
MEKQSWSETVMRCDVEESMEKQPWSWSSSAGGGGGLRWSETESVKEVAAAEENRQWMSLVAWRGKSEIGARRNGKN